MGELEEDLLPTCQFFLVCERCVFPHTVEGTQQVDNVDEFQGLFSVAD